MRRVGVDGAERRRERGHVDGRRLGGWDSSDWGRRGRCEESE